MKQGLPFLFTTSMECTMRHLAMVPFTLMRSSPPSFWHFALAWSLGMNECARLVHFKMRCLSGQGTADWELWGKGWCWSHSFLQEIPPPKHHLGARPFPQLLFSCYCKFLATFIFPFFPQELFPALPWLFLNDFYYIIAVSRLDVSGPKQTCAAKPERRTCRRRQAGGCWLPSPAHSSRQSWGRIPAASPSQTAAAKIGKKNTTRTVLMRHTQMDEYFIVIPGKAFKRTHKTTIMRSCLGTQIKNISNLTYKGKDFLNENIVSINHKIACTKTAKRCT